MIPLPPHPTQVTMLLPTSKRRRLNSSSSRRSGRRKVLISLGSLVKSWLLKWGTSIVLLMVTLSWCINLTSAQMRSVFDGNCPTPQCYCGLDPRHRREVACSSGNLDDIPVSRMSPNIEVIRIVAPHDRPNHLTIGRFFRQFRKLQELHIVRKHTIYWFIKMHDIFCISVISCITLTGKFKRSFDWRK